MDGYERLAIGVVEQAVNDYRLIKKCLREDTLNDAETKFLEGQISDIERFFKSEYGDVLCFGKAEWILDNLKRETA